MHLNIQQKILSGFLVVIILATVISFGAYISLTVIRDTLETLRPREAAKDKITKIEQILQDTEHHLDQYLTISGEEYRRLVSEDNYVILKEFDELSLLMRDLPPGTQPLLQRILTQSADAQQEISLLLSLDLSLDSAGRINNQILNTYEKLRVLIESVDLLGEDVNEQLSHEVAQANLIIDQTVTRVLFVMLFLVIFSFVVSFFIARTLTKPTLALIDAVKKIAGGAHGVRAPVLSRDEIGQLALVFNEMTATIENYTEGLERQVLERTKELDDKIVILNRANKELDRRSTLLLKRDHELTLANEKLHELDKIKSEFLSVAAHQLRTPLSAIKWIFSVLLEEHMGTLTTQQKSYLLKGEESNNRMVRLVDDMLTVTRIESGKTEYSFYVLSLDDVLKNLISDFLPRAKERGLLLTYGQDFQTPPLVSVDTEKIRFLFENLLENAMRYTPRGGNIHVSLSEEGEMLIVRVKDNGIGIPEHEQKNIFTKFFRADNAIKMVTDGSGLGLFVAKNVVEHHGGSITFESKQGEGTTFIIQFKRTHPEVAAAPPVTENAQKK